MRDAERHRGILLDDENRRALLVDRADDVEHLVDEDRRKAHRRLVHQQQLRPRHQRASDRDHLLLAARQRAGVLVEPLLDAREQCEHALMVGIEFGGRAMTPAERTQRQVLAHGHAPEQAARLGHQRDAAADDRLRRQPIDALAGKLHGAGGRAHHAEDGLHGGGLARGVAAEQADDFAGLDADADVVERPDRPVERHDIVKLQQRHGHAAAAARWPR